MQLSWTNPSTAFAGVTVRYAPGPTAPSDPSAGIGVPLGFPKAASTRLVGLTPGSRYAVAVWTYDAAHLYSRPVTSQFTTLPAPQADASISGTVTDTQGRPLENVHVYVETFAATETDGTTTDSAGRYALSVSPGGHYLGFDGALAHGGTSDLTGYQGDFATVEHLGAGESRSGVDAALAPGAAIAGRVTDAAGRPLAGVVPAVEPVNPYVDVTDSAFAVFSYFGPTAADPSGADGSFVIKGLAAAALRICLDPTAGAVTGGGSDSVGYLGRCAGRAVITRIGHTRTAATMPLPANPGGVIAGVVTDRSGAPVSGALVFADPLGNTAGSFDYPYGRTATDGSYRIAAAAGRYRVCAEPEDGEPAVQADGTGVCAAQSARVRAGEITSIDLRLDPAGGVAGRIVGPDGRAVPEVAVEIAPAHPRSGDFGFAVTDEHGFFRASGLAAGGYYACAYAWASASTKFPTGLSERCFDKHTPVTVRVGLVRLGLDGRLRIGGAISGRVTDDLGAPLTDVLVEADGLRGAGFGLESEVGSDGSYTMTGLRAGTYLVCPLWIPGAGDSFILSSFGAACAHPQRVTVSAGQVTSGVDFTVATGGSLDVTVKNRRNQSLGGVNVAALRQCPRFRYNCSRIPLFGSRRSVAVSGSAVTGPDGTATLTGLRPGTYALCSFGYYAASANADSDTGYADSCDGDTFDVTVANHATTTIGRTLHDAGAVTGTVTDNQGNPLSGVAVSVSNAATSDYVDPREYFGFQPYGPAGDTITDADGRFLIHGVQPGGQTVCADAEGATGGISTTGYLNGCVGGDRRATATPVDVKARRTTSVHLSLALGAAISGTISTPRHPLYTAALAIDAHGRGFAAGTDRRGSFRIDRLPAGTYRVCFVAFRYQAECYDDVPWNEGRRVPSAAAHIVLAAGQERRHVDAVLAR